MGVPESRWVYLHGCADTTEKWFVSERVNYRLESHRGDGKAGDCHGGRWDRRHRLHRYLLMFSVGGGGFPDALGIERDDTRPLTVTGGLPFHGGAGNNYSMNAIAQMMDVLRTNPGRLGMVTANGGYLSKHSAGIYSTEPPNDAGKWTREPPTTYQPIIDANESKLYR